MMNKSKAGVTLIELTAAMFLSIIIVSGAAGFIHHTAQRAAGMQTGQEVAANVRVAADALMLNIRRADIIYLRTNSNNMLTGMELRQIRDGASNLDATHPYIFAYNNASATRILFFGGNELARNLSEVRLVLSNDIIHVSVSSDINEEESITFTGSVDVRYKTFR